MKKFKNQLIRILKDEPFFGIADDGEHMLLYTQHFILSDKDRNAASLISDLWHGGYIKPDKTFTWGKYGIIPAEFNVPKNVTELYHKFMDAPRDSAEYTLHSHTNELGDIIGNVFAIVNDDNKILAEKYFSLFKGASYEFSRKSEGAFIVNNCHIIAPIKVHREYGYKVIAREWEMNHMKKIKRYGLPILTAWAWRQVGKVLLLAALVIVAAVTMGMSGR